MQNAKTTEEPTELTEKERRAVDLYVRSMNKAQSYHLAGYKDRRSYYKFFEQPKIKQAISRSMAVVGAAKEALACASLESIAAHLRANAFDVFNDDWSIKNKFDIPGDTQHAALKVSVKRYNNGKDLSVSVSIPSKLAVQKMALEYCNLISPDTSGDEPPPSDEVVKSFDEKMRLIREKAAQAAAQNVSPEPT